MTVTCPSMTCGEMRTMPAKLMLNQNLSKTPLEGREVNPGLRTEAGEADDLCLQGMVADYEILAKTLNMKTKALPVQVLIHLGAEVGGRDGLRDLDRGTKGGGVGGDIPARL